MAASRRDYEGVAAAIKQAKDRMTACDRSDFSDLLEVAQNIGTFFESQNPLFNDVVWFEACGFVTANA